MLRLLFSIIVLFAATEASPAQSRRSAQPVVYYLSVSGNDKNAGTKMQPWKTIQKLNSIPLKPGDKVLFKAGEIFSGTIQIDFHPGKCE